MAKPKNVELPPTADANERIAISPEDKAKAAKWFHRARDLGDKRQFDYAIEYYVNGLEFWPNAVEEACKPLHGCAVARRQLGGKKPGLKDTMKRSINDKDAKKALLNSAWLFGHDPDNIDYAEGIARAANKLHADEVASWAAGVCRKALDGGKKLVPKQMQNLATLYEEIGDRAAARGEMAFAVESLQSGIDVLNLWRRKAPRDRTVENATRDLSTKLTIVRGQYQEGDSFRDSIADKDAQRDLHDLQETKQTDDRVEDLIAKSEAAYRADPDHPATLNRLIDLLTRREVEKDETKATEILLEKFDQTGEYRHKHQADDIQMKQLRRKVRQATQSGAEEGVKQAQLASLKFDLGVYKERIARYPTDNRMKFEYGVRLFAAGRFDDAIPVFQAARADLKNRAACGMYLGRCFYRKGYFPQAINALTKEIGDYEYSDDDLAKSMLYWLARSLESSGNVHEARETYGKILQMDYNYKDVRAKLDGLPPDE